MFWRGSKKWLLVSSVLASLLIIWSCTSLPRNQALTQSAHYRDGQFRNAVAETERSVAEVIGIFWHVLTADEIMPVPDQPIPVQPLSREWFEQLPSDEDVVVRLGHSSILMSLGGDIWLFDPMFSRRASPVQWAGPERFHAPPLSIDELPNIKGVLISHNHYDHLDQATIEQLVVKTEHFYVPLGLGQYLSDWGARDEQYSEYDWWQQRQIGDTTVIATPTQHFSGRGLHDRDETLWASWVLIHGSKRYYFSGDSGYFDGFKTIGERFGPFDLTMLENGAYNERWRYVHMFPQESVQAHLDLRGQRMLPVHNSTFDLAMHPWYEPLEQVSQAAFQHQVDLITPRIGEPVYLNQPQRFAAWWRPMMPDGKVPDTEIPGANMPAEQVAVSGLSNSDENRIKPAL